MGTPFRVARKTRRVVHTAQVLTGQRTLHLGLFGVYTRKRRKRRPASRTPVRVVPSKRASRSRPKTHPGTSRVNPPKPVVEASAASTEMHPGVAAILASLPKEPLVPYTLPRLTLLRAGVWTDHPPTLRGLLQTTTFLESQSLLTVVVGAQSDRPLVADLARVGPLLITGPTGSGKSTVLHSLILSLLMRAAHPDLVRFLLVDSDGLELAMYNGLPQLVSPVITDPQKTMGAMRWAQQEAQRRYRLMTAARVRTFAEFNALPRGLERLPRLVVIVDHGDTLVAQTECREPVAWLQTHGVTVGIHTVVTASSRSRIPPALRGSFAGQLDLQGFAGSLEGGHGQWMERVGAAPIGVRTPQITSAEIASVVQFLIYANASQEPTSEEQQASPEKESDAIWDIALRHVAETGQASTSALQRHLRIGYTRAAQLIDAMEQNGYIGAADGARPRAVYLTPTMYEEIRQNKS